MYIDKFDKWVENNQLLIVVIGIIIGVILLLVAP